MRRNKQKSKIAQAIDLAEDIFREHYVGPETRQACFYWARAGLLACRAVGLDAVPQAGSVQWQIQHEDSENNAFAYSWQGLSSEETRVHASNGYLPEMHCWFALPREQVIVDLTAGFQRENCRRLTGLAWDDDLSLPRHIVIGHGPRHRHQHRWIYRPNHDATLFLLAIWRASPWGNTSETIEVAESFGDMLAAIA